MKLGKVAKYMDFAVDVILQDVNGNELWKGDMLCIQAAADVNNDKEQFLEECAEDEDYKTINSVLSVEKYLNWHLHNDIDGNYEALSFNTYVNDHGVTMIICYITITKDKEV